MQIHELAVTALETDLLALGSLQVVRAMIDQGKTRTAANAELIGLATRDPKALIGFAGPRVIEQTVREKLPEGFQRAEFLLKSGAIDMIVDRRKMREEIARLLALLTRQPADAVA